MSKYLSDTCSDLTAGESLSTTVAFDTYAPATYDCEYRFRPAAGAGAFTVAAADTGTSYRLTLSYSETQDLPPGPLFYVAYVTDSSSNRYIAEDGVIEIKPNPTTVTHAQRMLDAVRAVLENRAGEDQLTVAIGDIQLRHMTPRELMDLERNYLVRVRNEINAYRRARGAGSENQIRVKFT